MNIPKKYAVAIGAIGAALTYVAATYPAVTPFAVAFGAIVQAFLGQAAHNALPPVKP